MMISKKRNLFFLSAIFLLPTLQIGCTTITSSYYVSQSGNDDNPGSKQKPFKSLQKINSLEIHPGDKIYFKGGEIFPVTLSLNLNGTNDKPVIISSYENENGNATIDGGNKEAVIIRGNHLSLFHFRLKHYSGLRLIEKLNLLSCSSFSLFTSYLYPLYQQNRFYTLLFQMQELLSFFIPDKVCKVIIRFKFCKVDLIRLFNTAFYISIFIRPHPKQESSIVF